VAALAARTACIRLRWQAGYVSDYPDPLDEDTRIVTLNADTRMVTLEDAHVSGLCFLDSGAKDEDGYAIYRQISPFEQQTEHVPDATWRALLSAAETFDYVATVPATGSGEWRVRSRDLSYDTGEHAKGSCLIGLSPHLHVEPVGLLQGGGPLSPLCDLIRPAVLASRIVLTAHDRTDATAAAAWLHLDQGLVDALRPGDEVNLTRTPRGGLGLSVVRGGDLFVAVGAVTGVPLGSDLKVIVRRDRLVREIVYEGTNARLPWLHPIEFTSADRVPRKPKGYTMRQWSRAWPPPEDTDECVSIVRAGVCPDSAAFASAQLLALSDALHVERW
jgi:hypothetical protein